MARYHILKKAANGVMDQNSKFYPFRFAVASMTGKPNVRFFIDTVTLTSSQSGAVGTCLDKVEAVIDGVTIVIAQINIPATFAASNDCATVTVPVGILVDRGSAVTYTKGSLQGVPLIRYAEVYEADGEYYG